MVSVRVVGVGAVSGVYTVRVFFYKLDAALVVLVVDRLPLHALTYVHLLFRLENATQEKLLKLLVCEIDTELRRQGREG